MSDVVIGYDGSGASRAALTHGIEMAKALGDKVVIVFGYAPGGYGGGEVPAQREATHEFGEKVTKEASDALEKAGVEYEVELINKHPLEALMDHAEDRKARMIVVGARGEGPLKGAIIGSTPYKLVQLSETPVLVVPAE